MCVCVTSCVCNSLFLSRRLSSLTHVVFSLRLPNPILPCVFLAWKPQNRGRGLDMSVEGAWRKGVTGKGVVVSILDDGIEKDHPDLESNYDPR